MDGEAFGGGVIEEGNFVGDIHANWISNECFAALNLFYKEIKFKSIKI